jgi:hypothetical protein
MNAKVSVCMFIYDSITGVINNSIIVLFFIVVAAPLFNNNITIFGLFILTVICRGVLPLLYVASLSVMLINNN